MLWSAWRIPTQARIWITGTASSHCEPSTTGTKSGATITSATMPGMAIAPIRRVTRAQAAAIRSGSSCIRENAGASTRWSGPPMRLAGVSITLYATA